MEVIDSAELGAVERRRNSPSYSIDIPCVSVALTRRVCTCDLYPEQGAAYSPARTLDRTDEWLSACRTVDSICGRTDDTEEIGPMAGPRAGTSLFSEPSSQGGNRDGGNTSEFERFGVTGPLGEPTLLAPGGLPQQALLASSPGTTYHRFRRSFRSLFLLIQKFGRQPVRWKEGRQAPRRLHFLPASSMRNVARRGPFRGLCRA
jgi:hypothetical protein